VKIMDSIGDGTAYTRNGNFFVNNVGELVLGLGDGYKLIPPITVPVGTTDVSISQEGIVEVTRAGENQKIVVGQLKLIQFINPQGLRQLGQSLYTETDASGEPLESNPGEDGAGQILQGFLESSNVDPVKELVT